MVARRLSIFSTRSRASRARSRGALEAATTTEQRLTTIKRALEDSAADPKLMEERNTLERRLEAIQTVLSGDQALRRTRKRRALDFAAGQCGGE